MEETWKNRLAAEAVSAFETAENCGFVTRYSSKGEIEDNALEILQWMPSISVEQLTEEEFDYAVECMVGELH